MVNCLTYSIKEVAELIGISYSTAYKLALSGEIPFKKIGGQYFIPRTDFEVWFNSLCIAGDYL